MKNFTEKLEAALKQCNRITLPSEMKQKLKQQILAQVKADPKEQEVFFAPFIAKLKQVAETLVPSRYFRVILKEKLVAVASFESSRMLPRIMNWFGGIYVRRAFAAFVLMVFAAYAFLNFSFDLPKLEASYVTVMESVSGEVTVIRGGESMKGATGLVLKADDVVKTGEDSRAAILFLDQSVSRLDENTEVKISRLFMNPANKTETIVEVILTRGQLWSRVINLIDKLSRFQVKAESTVAVAKNKSAFNVAVQPKKRARVTAVQNQVDLVVATERKVVETSLSKGFAAEVKTSSTVNPKIVRETAAEKAEDEWVNENLAQDKVYIETVKQDVAQDLKDQVKALSSAPLEIALTFDEFEKQKKILLDAVAKLGEAERLIEAGNHEKSGETLVRFQEQLKQVIQWVKTREESDPAQALELKMQIYELLRGYEKKLSVILPTESLYPLKAIISETQVQAAPDGIQKTQEKLDQAVDKLLEAHDLIEQGDTATAVTQVDAYKDAIAEVVSEVSLMPTDEKEQAVGLLIENKTEDMKVLQAMATTPPAVATEPKAVPVAETIPEAMFFQEPLAESSLPSVDAEQVPLTPETQAESGVLQTQDAANAAEALAVEDLGKSVEEAKTDGLTKVGEAVFNVQKSQTSIDVLKKLEELKKLDVNGKQFMKVTVTPNKVTIKSIPVMPPKADSKTPKSLPALP